MQIEVYAVPPSDNSFDHDVAPNGNNNNEDILPLPDLQPDGSGVQTVILPTQPDVTPPIPPGPGFEASGVETVILSIQPPMVDGAIPTNANNNDVAPPIPPLDLVLRLVVWRLSFYPSNPQR
jgi:hypothetical protein